MLDAVLDAVQGADLVELLRPPQAVPIHYDYYAAFKSPLVDFQREIERRGLVDRVTYIERGETHSF